MTQDEPRDPEDLIQEKLGSNREILEALAKLDNELSEDARLALQMLEEGDQE